jgi:hypothetical protein
VMSMTNNLAPFVEMMLLMRIFDVVKPVVQVDLSPGYSILSPPTVSLVRYIYSLCSLISTTNESYVTRHPFGTYFVKSANFICSLPHPFNFAPQHSDEFLMFEGLACIRAYDCVGYFMHDDHWCILCGTCY